MESNVLRFGIDMVDILEELSIVWLIKSAEKTHSDSKGSSKHLNRIWKVNSWQGSLIRSCYSFYSPKETSNNGCQFATKTKYLRLIWLIICLRMKKSKSCHQLVISDWAPKASKDRYDSIVIIKHLISFLQIIENIKIAFFM